MIIVLGAFRSGTSLVSALLSALGADFGPRRHHYPPADRFNPTGYFQLRTVVLANRALMKSAGADVVTPPEPPAITAAADAAPLRELRWPGGAPPGALKDPRFSLTLDAWVAAGVFAPERLRLVVVERRAGSVAKSVLGHREVGAYVRGSLEAARAMTEAFQAGAAWHARERAADAITIGYEAIVADPAAEVARLAAFLGGADAQAQRRALALIGKDRALRRHYLGKLVRPGAVLTAGVKTARERLGF